MGFEENFMEQAPETGGLFFYANLFQETLQPERVVSIINFSIVNLR
jgi:hypothetical protein